MIEFGAYTDIGDRALLHPERESLDFNPRHLPKPYDDFEGTKWWFAVLRIRAMYRYYIRRGAPI